MMPRNRVRTAVTLAIPLLLALAASAEGEGQIPPPPEDPELRAQIEQWAADLGSGEYATRIEAENRLRETGRAALFALAPLRNSDDPEVQSRVQGLLDEMLWISPELQEEFDRYLDIMKDAESHAAWVEAHKTALRLSPAAERILDEFLRAPGGEAEIAVEGTVAELRSGEPVRYRLRVTNTGRFPIWLDRSRIRGMVQIDTPVSATVRASPAANAGAQAMLSIGVGGSQPTKTRYRYAGPGETVYFTEEIPGYSNLLPGHGNIVVRYGSTRPGEGVFQAHPPSTPVQNPPIKIFVTNLDLDTEPVPLRVLPTPSDEAPLSLEATAQEQPGGQSRTACGASATAALTCSMTAEARTWPMASSPSAKGSIGSRPIR